MAALARLKEKGVVRAVGVSVHDLGALATTATEPWVDVVLARINSKGARMDDVPDKVVPVLHRIHAAGKGLYGMKVLGQGELTGDVRGALAFVHGLGCVDSLNVGVESEAELRECVRIVEELDGE
jgi:aryl-alcohol dehydrogenase-like predicted oxidoreductase